MNKKIILNSLLVSGIVGASLFTGSVKAASNVPNYGKALMSAVEKTDAENYIMAVLLPSNNPVKGTENILTRAKFINLLETKYKKGIVKEVYKADGKTKVEDKVGTGCVVELTTGRKLTVVLYGDVNSDGQVNTNDTVTIAKYNVHDAVLNDYQKRAARLIHNETAISTNDSVRVAYYNVNGLNTDKAGYALVDMELYPEDYTGTDETVTSDTVLQSAIDDILKNGNNKELFDITLDGASNTAEFGLLDSEKKINEFVETGLIDKLVDQLKNNANLAKIELSVQGLEKPIVLDKNSDETACLKAAKELIAKLLNDENADSLLNKEVTSLFGKELKAKFYIADTSKLVDSQVEDADKIGGTYVEYTLKFVGKVNVDETMKETLQTVNETETAKKLFNITFDQKTNIGTFGFLNNTSQLSEFTQTGLVKALAEELKNPNIKKIELSILKNGQSNVYEKQTLTHSTESDAETKDITNIVKAADELLKAAFGTSNGDWKNKTVIDLAGKTLEAKIYINDNSTVYDTDVKSDSDGKYLEYHLNFLVDATNQIEKNILDKLNTHSGNNTYRVHFSESDDHLVNFTIKESEKSKKLSELYGKGTTGLVAMAKEILGADKQSEIKTITVNFKGTEYKVRGNEDDGTFSYEETVKLFNAIFATTFDATKEAEKQNPDTSKFGEATLAKLENVELEVKLGLSDEVVTKSTWNTSETFTVKFDFASTLQ